jgi:hypothetical protein
MPSIVAILLLVAGVESPAADGLPISLWTENGLSGYWRVETADFLPDGVFRAGGGAAAFFPGGDFGLVPFHAAATFGVDDGLEAGAVIPVYIHDSIWEGGVFGDLSLGIKYLYESARGGTALALKASASVPTGDTPRDRGAELRVGFCTSTVYRLFRLSVDADYFAAGGSDPLDARITDGIDVAVGGASFVLPELQVFLAAGSRTGEDPAVSAGAVYSPLEWLQTGLSAEIELADDPGAGVTARVAVLPGLI